MEEYKDWYRKMTYLAFYLSIFSRNSFFLEVFKCINYYYVFALTVLLPKMKMIPKNGHEKWPVTSFLSLSDVELRPDRELNYGWQSQAIGSTKVTPSLDASTN